MTGNITGSLCIS